MKISINEDRLVYVKKYASERFDEKGKPISLEDAVNDMLITAEGRLKALDRYNLAKGKKPSHPKAPKTYKAKKAVKK